MPLDFIWQRASGEKVIKGALSGARDTNSSLEMMRSMGY
jgi:hypothetical protein